MQGLLPLALCVGATLLAQSPVPVALEPIRFAGVFVSDPDPDGSTWVRGGRYKLGLGADGARYQPLFGPRSGRDYPIHLQLAQLAVDGTELPLAAGAPWQRREDRFTRERGAAREAWQVLAGHAQFYFEVPQPPVPGSLTLRIAVATDLQPIDDGPGVRFLAPGLGAVHCSDAVVFDADGRQLDVPVELGAGQLTIVVPASFTRSACWPLLVDPVLTPVVIDSTVSEMRDARVACEPTTGNWLVVAEEHLSATDVDIICTRYGPGSSPVLLDTIYADNTGAFTHNPDVGFVAATQRFLVGWHDATAGAFRWRNRHATSTTQGTILNNATGSGGNLENRLRFGSSYGTDRFLMVLFRRHGTTATPQTTVSATLYASGGTLFTIEILPIGTFASMQNLASPGEVSAIASATDKWVVVWPEMTATVIPSYLIRMQAIGFASSTGPLALEPSTLLSPLSSSVVGAASIAGRGGKLLAVWERVNPGTGRDIHGVPIGIFAGQFAALSAVQNLTAQELNGIAARAQREPDVSHDGIRFVYGYLEDDGAGTTLPRSAVVLVNGGAMTWHEGHLPLGTASASTLDLAFGADAEPGVHWAVFQQTGPTATGDVQAMLIDARLPGATSTRTQTGCGLPVEPGIAIAGTPALGRSFTVSLSQVPVIPILIVGPQSIAPLPGCGTCQLGIDAAAWQLFVGASLVVTVPADPSLLNLQLAFQGLSALQAGGCPTAFAGFEFALSDTLRIQVR